MRKLLLAKKNFKLNIVILVFILFGVMLLSVSIGSADLSVVDSLRLVLAKIPVLERFVDISDLSITYKVIVWKVRMPRIIMSALVGAILSIVGVSFQGIFRNPLADPHILGISSGAAFGATVAMVGGVSISFLGLGAIGAFSFVGALVTVFLVYHISKVGGEMSVTNMLLTGTAISTFLSSLISLLMTFHQEKLDRVYMWTLGSFSSATWDKVLFLFLLTIPGIAVLMFFARKLNIMLLGEDDAKSLGVDTEKTRRIIIITASLLVGAAVSVSGVIGFVGLIVPHCIRIFCGSDHAKLIPYSVLVGAVFMTVCDTIARTIAAPSEIAVGIITSMFGAPYFIFLVMKRRKKYK